jgi:[protein-PII] uridylyltransferase
VVDTFQVSDPDYAGVPPIERLTATAATIVKVLKGEEAVERLMSRGSRLPSARRLPTSRQATEVQIDNETSDRFTIIDVFADDRQGLLYIITHAIFQLGLSVHAARISTRLDQVADVFYVTDQEGAKIAAPARLETIRATIEKEIDRFLDQQVDALERVSSGSSS